MAALEAHDAYLSDDWKESSIFDLDDVFPVGDDAISVEVLGDASDSDGDDGNDDGFEPDEGLGAGDSTGPLIRYNGEEWIEGVPTRDDIVVECDTNGISKTIRHNLDDGKPVFFMPTDIEEPNEYAGGFPIYVMKLHGVLMNGAKAEVTITGVDVFFDVRTPQDGRRSESAFDAYLRRVLIDAGVASPKVETVSAFPINGYHVESKPYKRIHLNNLQQRKKAIAAVRAVGLQTASDDRSSYYRKAAREYGLPLSEWAILSDYEYAPGPTERAPLCAHVLRVPVASYRPLIDPMAAKDKRERAAKTKAATPLLLRDRTLVLTWDIETDSDRGTGEVPDAQHKGDNAFMIAMTAHWKDDPTPLKQVLLVDVETAPDCRWTTVVCGTPQNVLRAFALVYRGFAPEIQAGFNDSNYDWPFVVEKARQWNILGWMFSKMTASPRKGTTTETVLRWNYHREKKIKISAEESFFSSYLKIPGCVPQDVRVCYKKLFPKSETPKAGSLKFYLEISGLPGKADMPIKRMWRYRREALAARETLTARETLAAHVSAIPSEEAAAAAQAAEHMRQVGHYCIIDALRCQQLLVRRNVVNDCREVGSLAYVSYFDCHYYAGGMKVCNLLGVYACRRNILFSMIPLEQTETAQYPGAYVFPPEKGLTPNPDRLAAVDAAAVELRAAAAALETLREALQEPARGDRVERLTAAGARVAQVKEDAERTEDAQKDAERTEDAQKAAVRDEAGVRAAEERVTKARAAVQEALNAFASDRPVTGLDFASLYPSLIMTYNLSPERILLTEEEAEHWRAQGKKIHPIEFPYNGRVVRGWSILHENKPEEIGLYPSVLIDLFNKRAEMKAVLGQHGATKELIELIYGRAQKAFVEAEVARRGGADKGVTEKEAARRKPTHSEVVAAARYILAKAETERARTDAALAPSAPPPRISPGSTLAEELADLKRLNKNAKEQIEGINRLIEKGLKAAPVIAVSGTLADIAHAPADSAMKDSHLAATIADEYARAGYDWTSANTKQNALKVYMNTFYGEAGNGLSPFFLLQLAGGVTSSGVYNIKLVADFVQKKGFRIKYGDTDSLYLVCPQKYFSECDEDFVRGDLTREEWWSALVRITMRVMNLARDEVNTFLKSDNGSPYLKMAYEEVLFPVVFTGKKKYFGIPHLNEVNFRPKKLFVKGIDVVKLGISGLAREIGHRAMWACMALDNRRSVRQNVEDVLRDAVLNGAQWKFEHFIKTDAWKPNKNNVRVHRFIGRMRARHTAEVAEAGRVRARGGAPRPYLYDLPEAGERFSYVIAKQGAAFDLHGRKSTMKMGDRMEFSRAAKELGLEVDVAVYMISNVVGLCARFINSDPQFQTAANTRLTDKKRDEASQKAAKKCLENYVKSLSNLDSGMLRKRGYAYRRAYGHAASAVRGALVERVGGVAAEVLHGPWLDYGLFSDEDDTSTDALEDAADESAADVAGKVVAALWESAGTFAEEIVQADGITWSEELGLALGIEPNGSDSCPPSPRMEDKAASPPAKAASPPAKAEGGSRSPAAGPKKPPATRLYAVASGARTTTAKRRPVGSIVAAHYASSLDRQEAQVRAQMVTLTPLVSDIAGLYEADLSRLVHHLRLEEHSVHPEIGTPETGMAVEATGADLEHALLGVTADDQKTLLDFRQAWYTAVGIQLTRRMKLAFAAYLVRLKNKRLGKPSPPSKTETKKTIAEAANKLRVSGEISKLV
jgi:DNA polymerase elongation subunit (family B)